MLINPTTVAEIEEARKPPRTRAQAWEDWLQWAQERGERPIAIERARIACENNEPPWCWEEYLPCEELPPASVAAVKGAIEGLIADAGGKPIGFKRLWPEVQALLPKYKVTRDQVERLAPKAKQGRPSSK
jgi:hypothetical protein